MQIQHPPQIQEQLFQAVLEESLLQLSLSLQLSRAHPQQIEPVVSTHERATGGKMVYLYWPTVFVYVFTHRTRDVAIAWSRDRKNRRLISERSIFYSGIADTISPSEIFQLFHPSKQEPR